MGSEMYEGKALANQKRSRPETGLVRAFGPLLSPKFVALSRAQALEADEIEAWEMHEQLARYVRQLRHCQQPEELVKQNAADFIATTDEIRAATFGDPSEDEDARAEEEQARLDAIQERYWESRCDAAREGE